MYNSYLVFTKSNPLKPDNSFNNSKIVNLILIGVCGSPKMETLPTVNIFKSQHQSYNI